MRFFKAMFVVLPLSMIATARSFAAVTVTFEDKTLAAQSYYNGGPTTNSDGWTSGGTYFSNSYYAPYDSWSGWSYSNVTDATTAGYFNQYASFAGSGAGGSANYAVGYDNAYLNLPAFETLKSVSVTNTTYAALSMRDGDFFAKKFGGPSGNDPDYFKLIFTGYDSANGGGGVTGSVETFLADYTGTSAQDYILNTWRSLDLTPLNALGDARSVKISFLTTDNGPFGANTPLYVSLDNLVLVPEPVSLGLVGLSGLLLLRRGRRMI